MKCKVFGTQSEKTVTFKLVEDPDGDGVKLLAVDPISGDRLGGGFILTISDKGIVLNSRVNSAIGIALASDGAVAVSKERA